MKKLMVIVIGLILVGCGQELVEPIEVVKKELAPIEVRGGVGYSLDGSTLTIFDGADEVEIIDYVVDNKQTEEQLNYYKENVKRQVATIELLVDKLITNGIIDDITAGSDYDGETWRDYDSILDKLQKCSN